VKFRKKPVVIEAMQFVGPQTKKDIIEWVNAVSGFQAASDGGDCLWIRTLEGDHRADLMDWIIQGVKGEFYPRRPEIFAATYEACDGGSANG
jgi:hypothetical protein